MTGTASEHVPDPKRPPTVGDALWDALGRVARDLRRYAADLAIVVPLAIVRFASGCNAIPQVARSSTFDLYRPWVAPACLGLAVVVLVAMLLWSRRTKVAFRPHELWILGACVLAAPFVCFPTLEERTTFPVGEPIAVPGGGVVVRIQWPGYGGPGPTSFARRTEAGPILERYVELTPVGRFAVIRPSGVRHSDFRAAGPRCLVLTAGPGSGEWLVEGRDFASLTAAFADITPFVLLGAEDEGDPDDVEAIAGWLGEPSPALVPPESQLLAALDSPNRWIRDTARRLIEAGGERIYPQAMQRLRDLR